LLYQGAASFEIWTGRPAPVNVMRKAILNKLSAAGAEG
jgi:shikimate 5-dehydrogenase